MAKEKICNKCNKKYYECEIDITRFITVPKNPKGCCIHTKGPFGFKEILGD